MLIWFGINQIPNIKMTNDTPTKCTFYVHWTFGLEVTVSYAVVGIIYTLCLTAINCKINSLCDRRKTDRWKEIVQLFTQYQSFLKIISHFLVNLSFECGFHAWTSAGWIQKCHLNQELLVLNLLLEVCHLTAKEILRLNLWKPFFSNWEYMTSSDSQ